MAKVVLDGEDVDFQGPAPATASAVWSAVEGYLAGIERLIDSFRVDGERWDPESTGDISYERIEVRSVGQRERLSKLAVSTLEEWQRIERIWADVSVRVLSMDAEEIRRLGGECLEASGRFLQTGQYLATYAQNRGASWGHEVLQALEATNRCLSRWMDAFEGLQVVNLSEIAQWEARPAFEKLERAMRVAASELDALEKESE